MMQYLNFELIPPPPPHYTDSFRKVHDTESRKQKEIKDKKVIGTIGIRILSGLAVLQVKAA
jgi:hypothetical protein